MQGPLSLDEIRDLIAVAERGCCGEVVPELGRLLEAKVQAIDEQIASLRAFRARLVAFQAGGRSGCGCDGHGAFCGCLDGASELLHRPAAPECSRAESWKHPSPRRRTHPRRR